MRDSAADTDPLVRVSAGGATVSPRVEPAWRLAAAMPVRVAARAVDVLFLLAFALACWRLLARVDWSPLGAAALAMLLLFVAQGLFAAAPYQQRAVTLSGGDDWLGFEARGRAVATGDVLLRFGQPMGQAGVYYYYPGYSYFLAAVHALGSEDLSAPIFSHFLLLCAANLLVFGIAERVFDRRTAVGALFALVAIEELAFIRHYTVTLLSENLYFLTSAFTVDRLVRFAQTRQRAQLTWSGVPTSACPG